MTNIKFYKQLIDNMNDLVQSVDPDGKIIYVNKEWQKIMGYSAKEALGMPFSKIIHKDHFGQCRKVFDELHKKPNWKSWIVPIVEVTVEKLPVVLFTMNRFGSKSIPVAKSMSVHSL